MLQVNSTLFFQLANFLALIWILNRLLFKPFLVLIERRKEETEGARKKAEDAISHAENVRGTYEAGISEATAAAAAVNEGQKKAGRSEGAGIVEEARARSAGYLTATRKELQVSLDEVRNQMAGISAGLAREMTRKILGRDAG